MALGSATRAALASASRASASTSPSASSVVVRWAAARRRVRLHVQLAAFAADAVAHTLVLHSTPQR